MAQAWRRTAASRRVVGWGGLLGSTFLLASLLNAALTNGFGGAEQLASADSLPPQGTRQLLLGSTGNCEPIVSQPLYVGQDTWIRQTSWQCVDPLPAP